MTEFQISLLLIGAVVVVGVFAYNKWQERKAAQSSEEAFGPRHPDVLIGDEAHHAAAPASPPDDERIEPSFEERPLIVPERVPEPAREKRADVAVDGDLAAVDYMVEVSADEAFPVSRVHEWWAAARHPFAERATLSAWIDGQWRAVPQAGECPGIRAALQLVTRKGVLTESELIQFRSEVETLGAALGATVDAPEMREALESARRIDAVCADADIQIAFHVVASPGSAFVGTKLRAAAEASGLALDNAGRFTLRDDEGRELYSLADRNGAAFSAASMKDAAPVALTLSMDVPRAPDSQHTFEAMIRFGRQLASLLGGTLVDDNNQVLSERSIAAIDSQLKVVCRSLVAQGISPGSALALRIFS